MKGKFALLITLFVLMFSILFSGCKFFYNLIEGDSTDGGKTKTGSKDDGNGSTMTLESICQTFENGLDSDVWICKGRYAGVVERDPVFAAWPQYGDALVDTHGKVFELGYNSSLKTCEIHVSEESAVSFDYKCNTYNYLKVYVDDETEPAFEATGHGEMWQNHSVILSKGTHSLTFVNSGYYYDYIYLDNFTLAPNRTASVDIYPKGLQETYAGGMPIQFSAKALRSDGSVISGKNAVWTSSGGTVNSNGLFSPGSSSGMVSVTATIDGKKSSNNTVKVHGENYLSDSVTINGHEFTGAVTNGAGLLNDGEGVHWAGPTPRYTSFTADGFFVLKGTSATYDLYVTVKKKGDEENCFTDYIIPKGDFGQRIWLRFGDGEYMVTIWAVEALFNENYDGYEGEFNGFTTVYRIALLNVTNNTGLQWSKDDAAYLMPSSVCQSDDFVVSNAFNAVMAELPENAVLGQKLQALYDWELRRSHYDFVSTKDDEGGDSNSRRKKQDAVHVLLYKMGVCEGYANLYTALVRHLGVKAAYQTSRKMGHAWTELYYNGDWKLVDITWDDPVYESSVSNVEKNPTKENYCYFLIDRTGVDNDHYDNSTDNSRSAVATPVVVSLPEHMY